MRILEKFNLNDNDIHKLETIASKITFQPKELIIKMGERDRSVLIIKKGCVKVVVHHNDKPKIVANLSVGAILGELNFTIPLHRSADVIAIDETEVLIFNYNELCKLLDSDDNIAIKFFEGINLLLIERIYKMLK